MWSHSGKILKIRPISSYNSISEEDIQIIKHIKRCSTSLLENARPSHYEVSSHPCQKAIRKKSTNNNAREGVGKGEPLHFLM